MTNSQWLGAAVSYAAERGYRVISQSDNQVQMVKPKQKSCLLVAILLLLGILPGLVYLALSVDKSLLLTDTGDFIQSNQGKRKAQVVSYQALSEGKYGELIQYDQSAFGWGLLTLFVLFMALLALIVNTATPAVKLDPVAKTVQAAAKATERAKPTPTIAYEGITDFVDFATYPEKYDGKHVVFNCEVFNIINNQGFQCHLNGGEKVAYIHTTKPFGNIYDGDTLAIAGTVIGKQCGTNVFGAKTCFTSVEADKYDKLP